MKLPPLETLLETSWYGFSDEPIAQSGTLYPRLSDPAYLLAEESPDSIWHLFAHTWNGVEHYTSSSGLDWHREHLVFLRGHSPFLYREGTTYFMLFEIHDRRWWRKGDKLSSSRIMISSSTDLSLWSEPKLLINSEDIPDSSFRGGPARISRPQLIHTDGIYRLYFGAGETIVPGTEQKTTARLMYAESEAIEGPYTICDEVLMETEPESQYRNIAPGGFRIVECEDGFAAVECSYYYCQKENRIKTAMLLLTSEDGLEWELRRVLQESPEKGWASRHITSCDLRYKENEESWYCYYSANSEKKFLFLPYIRESLGLLLGKYHSQNR